ncbi:hypothetical protein GQ55_2G053800 [Panicum hallii var. hallii]|uniref:F-box protein At3g26010-like beta-propeller domain-containing protein n=1 Tax=Panicum hallii var. hallii TaxID=1504633 RepID=A0A2T7ELS2_9POAL|nr:hypothetical protein GQ55_2G053800 [Panicum hallii var. hallii]
MLHFIFYQFRREEFEIVAVDGEGKRCRVIRWPEKHRFGNAAFIGQSQGRLRCISGLRKQNVEGNVFQLTGLSVWILEDYDAEEWVLKHSVSFLRVFGRWSLLFPSEYHVVALHPDRNLVFLVHHRDQKLISCVLRTLGQGYSCVTLYRPCFESSVLAYGVLVRFSARI